MRQRLIYILKHNPIIQHLYKSVMSCVFQLWGRFLKTDENLVLFVSFMGTKFNDSPKVIYEYMQAHPVYGKYRCVWAFERPNEYPQLDTVKIDSLAYFMLALKARYWVTNTNIERGLRFKKNKTIYLNTWHGVALKKIGNDCPGRKDYNFDTVDYLVVSGDYDEKIFRSAFNAKNSSYLKCGMPRNEQLWLSEDFDKAAAREKLGIPVDKKVILYAPTWRESANGGRSYEIKPPIHFEKWRRELGDEYIVLFRAHHLTTKILGLEYDEFLRNMSDYPDVNELMIAADMLITDYSAIAFDYSILCRPIFCYTYDYDTYLAERGTYFDIDDEYPNKSSRSEDELLNRIKQIDYKKECTNTRLFRDKFIQYGHSATEACVKALFGELRE